MLFHAHQPLIPQLCTITGQVQEPLWVHGGMMYRGRADDTLRRGLETCPIKQKPGVGSAVQSHRLPLPWAHKAVRPYVSQRSRLTPSTPLPLCFTRFNCPNSKADVGPISETYAGGGIMDKRCVLGLHCDLKALPPKELNCRCGLFSSRASPPRRDMSCHVM